MTLPLAALAVGGFVDAVGLYREPGGRRWPILPGLVLPVLVLVQTASGSFS
ncbi:MAG: hypothetical protein WDM88_07735 [Galbitalea sp.]